MTEDLINRITYHLSSGGLFNPELADHLAVRNLLMECREALAQPEQEPLKYTVNVNCGRCGSAETYDLTIDTTPPQRKPLSDEEIGSCIDEVNLTSQYGHHHFGWHKQFARAIEAAVWEK